MKRENSIIIVLTIIFVVLLGTYVVRGGYYPVALVHGDWISARQFNRDHVVYGQYFQEFAKVNQLVLSTDNIFDIQVGRDGLDRLIELSLVREALHDIPGREVERAVREQIDREAASQEVADLRELFGDINQKEFERIVLAPRAERMVLAEYLEAQGQDFNEWLQNVRKEARVVIFLDPYDWNGEEVVAFSGS